MQDKSYDTKTTFESTCVYCSSKINVMKFLLFVVALLITGTAFSQTSIKLEDAGKHAGDSVNVCGKVAGGIFLEQMEGSPTFLALGAAYPDQLLTVMIAKDQRGQFQPAPETYYIDKDVCVTGKIVIVQERPQITIYRKEQIKVATK
jgi:hypothetical protein